jgi:hypothetical protein
VAITNGSSATVGDNLIVNNTANAGDGGGIGLQAAGAPIIRGNVVIGNAVSGLAPCSHGGGIASFGTAGGSIASNLIASNSAGCGGGVYWQSPGAGPGMSVINNTIADNSALQGAALFADGDDGGMIVANNILVASGGLEAVRCGETGGPGPPDFQFNDVYSATGPEYAGSCGDPTGVNGNVSADPQFVGGGDYHLQPSSPAVDAGTASVAGLPALDIDRQTRPLDGEGSGTAEVDMGVDELKSLILDTDGDGIPNGTDTDDDADGCADDRELGLDSITGGNRNPHSFWDFFDVPTLPGPARNQTITIADISAIIPRFGATRPGGPPSKAVAFAEALTVPPPAPAYHASYDRTLLATQATGPPNGSMTVQDIVGAVIQFGVTCL